MYDLEETRDENNYTSDSKSFDFSNEQFTNIDLNTILSSSFFSKLAHTFPETFYFPSLAFAYPSLIVR